MKVHTDTRSDQATSPEYLHSERDGLHYYMIPVTSENIASWTKFGDSNNPIGRNAGVIGYKETLRFYQEENTHVWISFISTKKLSAPTDPDADSKTLSIQIVVPVVTSDKALFSTHMGIFRTITGVMVSEPLAMKLHSFAAKATLALYPEKEYMFTSPVESMANIVTDSVLKNKPDNFLYLRGLADPLMSANLDYYIYDAKNTDQRIEDAAITDQRIEDAKSEFASLKTIEQIEEKYTGNITPMSTADKTKVMESIDNIINIRLKRLQSLRDPLSKVEEIGTMSKSQLDESGQEAFLNSLRADDDSDGKKKKVIMSLSETPPKSLTVILSNSDFNKEFNQDIFPLNIPFKKDETSKNPGISYALYQKIEQHFENLKSSPDSKLELTQEEIAEIKRNAYIPLSHEPMQYVLRSYQAAKQYKAEREGLILPLRPSVNEDGKLFLDIQTSNSHAKENISNNDSKKGNDNPEFKWFFDHTWINNLKFPRMILRLPELAELEGSFEMDIQKIRTQQAHIEADKIKDTLNSNFDDRQGTVDNSSINPITQKLNQTQHYQK